MALVSDVSNTKRQISRQIPQLANELIYLTQDTPLPIVNNYSSKATLGVDRLATAAGTAYLFPNQNMLVADLGTCMTLDFVSSKKVYEGGIISPGLSMRLGAMHDYTANLPLLKPEKIEIKTEIKTEIITGKTTKECMLIGANCGVVAEIEYMFIHYAKTYPNIELVLTGGDSALIGSMLSVEHHVQKDLALWGLYHILSTL